MKRIDMDTVKDAAILGLVLSISFLLIALGTLLFSAAFEDRPRVPSCCECRR